jgi:hypothetical protein
VLRNFAAHDAQRRVVGLIWGVHHGSTAADVVDSLSRGSRTIEAAGFVKIAYLGLCIDPADLAAKVNQANLGRFSVWRTSSARTIVSRKHSDHRTPSSPRSDRPCRSDV